MLFDETEGEFRERSILRDGTIHEVWTWGPLNVDRFILPSGIILEFGASDSEGAVEITEPEATFSCPKCGFEAFDDGHYGSDQCVLPPPATYSQIDSKAKRSLHKGDSRLVDNGQIRIPGMSSPRISSRQYPDFKVLGTDA